jgi:TIGR00252 family protein
MIGMKFLRLSPRQKQGQLYEQLALSHLQRQGLTLITRNYRCRSGEIDLVMRQRDMLVFVEVRYRHRADFGSALASVNYAKQRRVIHAAQHFLQHHPCYMNAPCRFDVVAVSTDAQGPRIEWISNAFD